jgi:hypothetical protein
MMAPYTASNLRLLPVYATLIVSLELASLIMQTLSFDESALAVASFVIV